MQPSVWAAGTRQQAAVCVTGLRRIILWDGSAVCLCKMEIKALAHLGSEKRLTFTRYTLRPASFQSIVRL